MNGFELIVRPLAYAALVACVFMPLERLWPRRRSTRREFCTDIAFATVGGVLTRITVFALAGISLAAIDAVRPVNFLVELPRPVALAIGLLYFEVAGYAYHRVAHRWAPLWRLHAVHHSSTDMDFLAGFRQHPLEIGLMTLAQNLPLVALGMPLGDHAILVAILQINTQFVHSNLRTPRWLSYLVATPDFHHRHHALDGSSHPDANFSTLFPVIDRIFGTFARDRANTFGLENEEDNLLVGSGFWSMLTRPLSARRLQRRFSVFRESP